MALAGEFGVGYFLLSLSTGDRTGTDRGLHSLEISRCFQRENLQGRGELLNPPEGIKREHKVSFEYQLLPYKIFAVKLK